VDSHGRYGSTTRKGIVENLTTLNILALLDCVTCSVPFVLREYCIDSIICCHTAAVHGN